MTVTQLLTRRGNVIHLMSFSDLIEAVQRGERLRSYCPIHGSDHQRSLSIDLDTGWGYCHSCHATVLVQPEASVITNGHGNVHGHHHAHAFVFDDEVSTELRPSSTLHPCQRRKVRLAAPLPHWQREEVAALRAVAPLICEALVSSRRAHLYLTQRALPPTLAQASGVGYLSRAAWEQAPVSNEQHQLLKRWIGRII